jgi:hypothetical protein
VRSTAVGTGSTCARVSGTLTPLIFLLVNRSVAGCRSGRSISIRRLIVAVSPLGFAGPETSFGAVRPGGHRGRFLLAVPAGDAQSAVASFTGRW